MNWLFNFIVFPGFIFTAAIGMLASWFDRKLTARVQWRVGPPVLQPLYDFVKLLGKETIVPKGSFGTFVLAPILSLVSVTIVSTMVWNVMLWPERGFVGDLIVTLYLLTIPSIALIIGGAVSRNPLASLGVSREIKLMLSYELPFIIAMFVPVIKAGGSIKLGDLLTYQWENGLFIGSWSGAIAFACVLACIQAKLAYVPFDIPEAETEINNGPLIEYSGTPLAIFKLSRWMLLFVLPIFVIFMFMGGISLHGWHILWGILKYIMILGFVILVKATNPRVRIDQALKFFWWGVTPLAIVAVILAFVGV